MISSSDPFAQSFDSIRLEDKSAQPSVETPAHEPPTFADLDAPHETPDTAVRAAIAPPEPYREPGFYLLDDAAGRFTIDRDSGVVMLTHDHLLALESGAVHPVLIRVVEASGATYDLKLRLRMTGRVPQMAGAEENDSLAALCTDPLHDLMVSAEVAVAAASEETKEGPQTVAWAQFAAAREAHGRLRSLTGKTASFGALLEAPSFPGYLAGTGQLSLAAPPPPVSHTTAEWTI